MISFTRQIPRQVVIGDEVVPIKVRRFDRTEREAFDRGFNEHVLVRGTREGAGYTSEQDNAAIDFMEHAIRTSITVEAGHIEDDGEPVTDGDGLIRVFGAHVEVLGALLAQIAIAQHSTEAFRKNLKSPRASASGSQESIPAHGGEKQGSTAASVDDSGTAPIAGATASIDSASSGAHDAATASQ